MIEFRSVRKAFPDGTVAVEDFSFVLPSHQTTVLVGSSGCGKTTLLRMINRMVEPTSGQVLIDDVDVASQDKVQLRRNIGYVLQAAGLLPHRTVIDNVATVPVLKGVGKAAARASALELLDKVGLDRALAPRYPRQLSGGQQQRVGVARALASDPNILLMDEPFGAVDPIVRADLQVELNRLQRELGKTIVFVTHDIDEAFTLADQVVIFKKGGVIAQAGTPAEILADPADAFVASFIGADRGGRDLFLQQRSGDGGLTLVVDGDGRPLGVLDPGSAETPDSGTSAT
jgi:osmoprotectant transport system ATP-binding protein